MKSAAGAPWMKAYFRFFMETCAVLEFCVVDRNSFCGTTRKIRKSVSRNQIQNRLDLWIIRICSCKSSQVMDNVASSVE
jgi:hypothetical protein